MHFWHFGGAVIDTPGVREFAMIDVEKEEIQHYFPEILKKEEIVNFIIANTSTNRNVLF
jgi:ribosome biogenesis GTPase